MIRTGLLLIACLALGGCASTLTAVFDRAVNTEPVGGTMKTADGKSYVRVPMAIAMTGERRIIVGGPRANPAEGSDDYLTCAESLPDTARAVKAVSSGKAEGMMGADTTATKAEVSDSYETALMLTFNRTETSDVVRKLGWQNCLAYLNGGIDRGQYQANLNQIIGLSMDVLKVNAEKQPPKMPDTILVFPGVKPEKVTEAAAK